VVRRLSERPTLWRRFNSPKCNHLRAAPAPSVYLFGAVSTKAAGNRRFDNEPFFRLHGAYTTPIRRGRGPGAGANVGRKFFGLFWSPAGKGNAYPTPQNARKDHFRSVRDQPAR
jgi:hypothetical protein